MKVYLLLDNDTKEFQSKIYTEERFAESARIGKVKWPGLGKGAKTTEEAERKYSIYELVGKPEKVG